MREKREMGWLMDERSDQVFEGLPMSKMGECMVVVGLAGSTAKIGL